MSKALEVIPYTPGAVSAWNDTVRRSRNGNFLHDRRFMDYHADRFTDASLIIQRAGESKPLAVFPANRVGTELVSHGGLTYGGVICGPELNQSEHLEVFSRIRAHCQESGIERVIYKAVPHVFHRMPCEEDLYALTRLGARLLYREASSVFPLQARLGYSKGRKWSIAKARKAGVYISEEPAVGAFHACLRSALARHGVGPVHTVAELNLLRDRFPQQIRIFAARLENELLAGVLVFDFGHVIHTQYMASSEHGKAIGALDLVIDTLANSIFSDRQAISFGISTTQHGNVLNTGLIAQKESFGARCVVHDTYEWLLSQEAR